MQILTRILLGLPPLLILISFVFAIVATVSSYWATTEYIYSDITGTVYPIGQIHRGPFKKCQPTLLASGLDPTNQSNYYNDCSVTACNLTTIWQDPPYLCQQIAYTKHLLIAGDVLTGVAFVMTCLFVLPWTTGERRGTSADEPASTLLLDEREEEGGKEEKKKKKGPEGGEEEVENGARRRPIPTNPPDTHSRRSGHHDEPGGKGGRRRRRRLVETLLTFTHLLVVMGLITLAMANWLGSNLLVNNAPTDGDALSGDTDPDATMPHWMVGKASWFAFAGWMPALVAAVVFPTIARLGVR